ncbi:MAG TPA: S41 family peptidase [Kofleriaceae bacterium]|nr:S41 family peptidase [Kofleriaceae bacterium]
MGAVAAPKRPEATRYKTLDTFAQSLSYVSNQFVEPVEEKKLLYAAARGMLSSLDAYSAFFSPSEYRRLREDTDGEFPGVGLVLGPGGDDDAMPDAKEWPIVDEVLAGSPAEKAGIEVDDRILTVDGASTVNPDGTAIKDERFWDGKLRGPSGTRVKIEFVRAGSKPAARGAEMVRAQIKVPSVMHEVLAPGIGYLSIRRFQEATAADAALALAELDKAKAARAIIIDLRTDSGGLLDQAIAIADQFLDSGLIVTIRGRTDAVETHTAHAGGLAVSSKVILLVNAETASAAEILAGALQDHKRATVIGMRTYGKGAIQTYFDLIDGSGLKLTTHRYVTPAGHQVEGRGITPDVEVPEFEAEVVVAGGSKASEASPGSGPPSGKPGGTHDILEARLAEDYQLRIAYQTARGWLGSK